MTAVALPSDRASASTEAARLFEAYSAQLLGYCLGQLGSRLEAEDAVQTTFLYALRALRRGVIPECESAWLTTIARNVCHTHRRTLGRRGPVTPDVELDRIALAQPDHDDEELLAGLRDALASLPDNQRRALVLREWHGVAPREIATQLGISGPATHALLTRARRSLAQALTLPKKPVLGVAWLVLELRSQIKALLTGVSTKAAVASVAVVGLGVGGVAFERSQSDPRVPPASVRAADRPGFESTSTAPSADVQSEESVPPNAISRARPVSTVARPSRLGIAPVALLPNRGDPEENAVPAADASPPAPEIAVDLPVEAPKLPKVERPLQLLPPIDVPKLPPVELPPLPATPLDLPLPSDLTENSPLPGLPLP